MMRIKFAILLLLAFLGILIWITYSKSNKPEGNNGILDKTGTLGLKNTWQIQLSGELNLNLDADIYDLDYEQVTKEQVLGLKNKGIKPFCYVNVGAWEDFRRDKDGFPNEVIGKVYEGFEDERWLDIRRIDKIGGILEKRFDICKEKGFVGIDPDNVNGYENETGFGLTYQDQIEFNKWVSMEVRKRGLLVGLKNDEEQVLDLVDYFDFAVTEDCFKGGWCRKMTPFVEKGKPVLAIEYTDTGIKLEDFCSRSKNMGISAILKNRSLDAFRKSCE